MYYTRTLNGVEVAFDDRGSRTSKYTIVIFPGLGMDIRSFKYILPYLLPKYRVIRLIWRGHGMNRDPYPRWTIDDQANDTIALMDSLEIGPFVPLTHSHGSWAAFEVADSLGKERVPAILLTDLILTEAPQQFIDVCKLVQKKETWFQGRQALYAGWTANTTNHNMIETTLNYGGGHGFESWSHFCWLVESAYKQWGSPMNRMEHIREKPLIRHVFSHSNDAKYLEAHQEYKDKHPEWFSFTRLNGETHFPVIELPLPVALELDGLTKNIA